MELTISKCSIAKDYYWSLISCCHRILSIVKADNNG
nr:MAG TPA: hypothetical protein [Caudoviricetes sp.]